MNTRDRLAEALADVLIAHGQRRHDEESGVLHCRCGWSGPYLSRHQRDALLPVVEQIAAERAAEELRAAAEAWERHGWTVVTIEAVRARAAGLTDKDGQR